MRVGRVALLLVLALSCALIESKVFTRCQLTRELLKNNFPRTFLSNWVCLAEQESNRDTAAFVNKTSRRKYYGIFQATTGFKLLMEGKIEEADPIIQKVVTMYDRSSKCTKIGSEWCKEGRKGGKCDITCEALLNDDIKDDATCALKVFEMEGFKYWPRWEARCKGQTLPDIEKCPGWQHPPSRSSVSPGRDKRFIRHRRSVKRLNILRKRQSRNGKIYI